MRVLKAVFDSVDLLNPGRVVHCAGFGAMHVSQGEMPFPEREPF